MGMLKARWLTSRAESEMKPSTYHVISRVVDSELLRRLSALYGGNFVKEIEDELLASRLEITTADHDGNARAWNSVNVSRVACIPE